MRLEVRNTLTGNLEIGFADSGTSPIAVILPERFQTAGGYAETRPDIETARLFAAAPELLSAAVQLRDFLQTLAGEVQIPSSLYLQGKRAMAAAESAFSKAERGEA